jgi:hypothetical protein
VLGVEVCLPISFIVAFNSLYGWSFTKSKITTMVVGGRSYAEAFRFREVPDNCFNYNDPRKTLATFALLLQNN